MLRRLFALIVFITALLASVTDASAQESPIGPTVACVTPSPPTLAELGEGWEGLSKDDPRIVLESLDLDGDGVLDRFVSSRERRSVAGTHAYNVYLMRGECGVLVGMVWMDVTHPSERVESTGEPRLRIAEPARDGQPASFIGLANRGQFNYRFVEVEHRFDGQRYVPTLERYVPDVDFRACMNGGNTCAPIFYAPITPTEWSPAGQEIDLEACPGCETADYIWENGKIRPR